MKNLFKNIFISIGIAFILEQFQIILKTDYLIRFLEQNLVSLLIALLAINTASLGIILSKIRELLDKNNQISFDKTKKEMFKSIQEQIILIFLSLVILMLISSSMLKDNLPLIQALETIVVACFVFSILILYDTAKSVFIILNIGKG
ncbi:hypothetical protein ACX8XP_14715 [Calditrichota bacterium LG25]